MAQMKNMVAVGASSALLGFSLEAFQEVIEEKFLRKGQQIVDKNMEAIQRGAQHILAETGGPLAALQLEPADGKKRLYMIGNDAIPWAYSRCGLGLMAAYPITPSSEILDTSLKNCPSLAAPLCKQRTNLRRLRW